MADRFPPDVQDLINEQMIAERYQSEDDVLRDALQAFRELKSREEMLLAEVKLGIEQADQGLAGPLDVKALIDRCSLKLAEEGILD